MELNELTKLVDLAINDCEQVVLQNPKAVLSEGDFEKLLSELISRRIGYVAGNPNQDGFAVYNQISHYDNEKKELDARVDILLMRPNQIEICYDHNKRIVYKSKESVAIELKYKHRGCVSAVKQDINKYYKYKEDSLFYVIILLDDNKQTSKYKRQIENYYKTIKEALGNTYEDKFFCKVLVKQ